MQRTIVALEAILILLPISIISLWGGTGMIVMLIADDIDPTTALESWLYIIIIGLALLSLIAFWVEIFSRLIHARSLMSRRLVIVPMHIGALIVTLSVISMISLLLVPESYDSTGSIAVLAFGSPVLLPYFHLLSTRFYSGTVKNKRS